mmetsp:Transcript_37894/g.119619  ORF Transcript_37894/g.119619 Transcript_37894/m.119619 type:complete len:111 (+) Transcript_37894:946-1278(+)
MEVYLQTRLDVMRLTGRRWRCPDAITSGAKTALLAQKLCRTVDAFGFSYSQQLLRTRPGHMDDGQWGMSSAHAWDFEVMLIRLLHMAGRIDICTADVPGLGTDDLLGRGR